MTALTTKAPAVEVLSCGCTVKVEGHGGKRVVVKCVRARVLFEDAKKAGKATHDPKIRGGAKVAACREFDRRRTLFHQHVFGTEGAR